MKVVIAAAGQGTRMLHLSNNKPKHLINVKDRPFLAYVLDNLLAAGYKEIILVVGYKEDLMKEFLDDYSCCLKNLPAEAGKKRKISFVSQYEFLGPKEKEYGTACPIKCVKNIIGKSNFIYLYGDNLYSIRDLKAMNIRDNYNYAAGLLHQNPEKYGVLVPNNGLLKEIIEKPKEYISNLINAGLYKFTPDIFKKISKIKKSPRGEYEITDAISLLAKNKKVKIKIIKDCWIDFGNPGDVLKFSNFLKNGGYNKNLKIKM
ncbi:MAG: sugar phosphate nucleotidyltransferase [Patescibacteria group bacterium]